MLQLFETHVPKAHPAVLPTGKAALGQYMTPAPIAAFMASLFPKNFGAFHLLDAGAGEGSLTCSFLKALRHTDRSFPHGEASLFEYDVDMARKLEKNIIQAVEGLPVKPHIYHTDFIEYASTLVLHKQRLFTHAILNPPYKKISGHSAHRALLRDAGIETVNLYTAFVALSLALLRPGGTLVAIIPRSFCNGPYYRPFRQYILRHSAIRRLHLFTSRTEAFKEDKVLQENVILVLERDAEQSVLDVSTSKNGEMDEYREARYPFEEIVRPGNPELFIHIPDNQGEQSSLSGADRSLKSLGVEVSTGPVVDFRLKEHLRAMPLPDDAPLLYPGHFNGKTKWPRANFKKPNAVARCPETMKWLYPNGHYVVVRRLSSKEEKRRVVAYHVQPEDFPGQPYLGFENHLNVFHRRKQGLSPELAHGLALYLNSGFVDKLFRRFNGHTQVNATDLRSLPYPSADTLEALGRWADGQTELTQENVEQHLKAVLA